MLSPPVMKRASGRARSPCRNERRIEVGDRSSDDVAAVQSPPTHVHVQTDEDFRDSWRVRSIKRSNDVPAELRLKLVAVVGLYDVHAERQQFTAIDDCTRIRVLESYDACNQATAVNFVDASGSSAFWSQECARGTSRPSGCGAQVSASRESIASRAAGVSDSREVDQAHACGAGSAPLLLQCGCRGGVSGSRESGLRRSDSSGEGKAPSRPPPPA